MIPLRTGRAVVRAVEVNPARATIRVEVSEPGGDPAFMRVHLPRPRTPRARLAIRWPVPGDVVRFDGLQVQLVTVRGRCRWAVRADGVEVVDRVAA